MQFGLAHSPLFFPLIWASPWKRGFVDGACWQAASRAKRREIPTTPREGKCMQGKSCKARSLSREWESVAASKAEYLMWLYVFYPLRCLWFTSAHICALNDFLTFQTEILYFAFLCFTFLKKDVFQQWNRVFMSLYPTFLPTSFILFPFFPSFTHFLISSIFSHCSLLSFLVSFLSSIIC